MKIHEVKDCPKCQRKSSLVKWVNGLSLCSFCIEWTLEEGIGAKFNTDKEMEQKFIDDYYSGKIKRTDEQIVYDGSLMIEDEDRYIKQARAIYYYYQKKRKPQ